VTILLHPVDTYKSRVILHDPRGKKEVDASSLWNGIGASVIHKALSRGLYYFVYERMRADWRAYTRAKQLSVLGDLSIGFMAAAITQLFTLPLSVIKTVQQTERTAEGTTVKVSFSETAGKVYEQDGVGGFWRGLSTAIYLCVDPSITFLAFDRLERFWLGTLQVAAVTGGQKPARLSSFQVFVLGAVSKIIATVITYPLTMAKVRLQNPVLILPTRGETVGGELRDEDDDAAATALRNKLNVAGLPSGIALDKMGVAKSLLQRGKHTGEATPYNSTLDVLVRTWLAHGPRGLYIGMTSMLFKSATTSAFGFASKDFFMKYAVLAMRALGAE